MLIVFAPLFLFANNGWFGFGWTPISILEKVVSDANEDQRNQHTKVNGVTSTMGGYSGDIRYRITNTLERIKNNIHPYIQWFVYLGLAIATILIIYNGFLMVTNVTHGKGEVTKIKDNIIYLGIGVVILTGFYYFIDIILAIVNYLFT